MQRKNNDTNFCTKKLQNCKINDFIKTKKEEKSLDNFKAELKVDTNRIVLSSDSTIKKTETFIAQTKYILMIDFFVSKIAEAVQQNFDKIAKSVNNFDDTDCFKVETNDKAFSFLLKFGFMLGAKEKKDIIFFNFLHSGESFRQNDTRVQKYLQSHKTFFCTISKTKDLFAKNDFNKQYRIGGILGINFPVLSQEQLKLVETENKNVVIQGVAGSGKTNVCIEKLIYTASKNYGGRVLYTTFSRGLLMDTKLKIEQFKQVLQNFVQEYQKNNVVFLDDNHKKAIENYLGIFFFLNDDEQIVKKIKRIVAFFEQNVDYFLIEDLFCQNFASKPFAGEEYFLGTYIKNLKNHQLSNRLAKLKDISFEVIYKEVFGIIYGSVGANTNGLLISEQEYCNLRKDCFEKFECQTIYAVAVDYCTHLQKNNLTNNNFASKQMLENLQKMPKYSLAIVDEVQDFSKINLQLFKAITIKMFCAGDALQMVNPTYFSFAYLKNLLFEKDVVDVAELQNNYRNTQKIQQIINALGEINVEKFGTHNFVTNGKTVESGVKTTAIYCNSVNFAQELAKNKYENFTVVVASKEQKQNLRKILKNQEILTVAEIKGLERSTVVLYDILSDNQSKWQALERSIVNKKQADENSVYRYYFNLFYVGISRAKQHLFVIESKKIGGFMQFFQNNFVCKNLPDTIEAITKIVSKIEYTQQEYLDRITEFLRLEQFDNARFVCTKLTDDLERQRQESRIDIYQVYVHFAKHKEAGIKFWQLGLLDEAKKQFTLSGDKTLIDFVDAISQKNQSKLNIDIVQYFDDVKDSQIARQLIVDTIKADLEQMRQSQKLLHEQFKKIKETKNGK